MKRLCAGILLMWAASTATWATLLTGGATTRLKQATCTSDTCNAQSPTWCQAGTAMYFCDLSGGVYVGVASLASPTVTGNITMATANATVDDRNLDLVAANARIVHICDSGCEYTTLNAACAGETSTATSPIIYHIVADNYTGKATCSGEDWATFMGDGASSTEIFENDGSGGDHGALELGTSTNITVTGLHLRGHRGLWWDALDTGGGRVRIHDVIFETVGAALDEDCMFWRDFNTTSTVEISDSLCLFYADGFTIDNDATGTTRIYSHGNTFRTIGSVGLQNAAWALRSIPCRFHSEGDVFDLVGTRAGAPSFTMAYHLDGNPGDGSSGCAANTAEVRIQSPTVFIHNTAADGDDGQAIAILMPATSTEIGNVWITNMQCEAKTDDATAGDAFCLRSDNASASSDVHVIGGRMRTSGGAAATTFDFHTNAVDQVGVLAVDYQTVDSGGNALRAIDQQNILAGNTITLNDTTSGVTGLIRYLATSAGSGGVLVDSVAAGSTYSPSVRFSRGGTANQVKLRGNDSGGLEVQDESDNVVFHFRPNGSPHESSNSIWMYGDATFARFGGIGTYVELKSQSSRTNATIFNFPDISGGPYMTVTGSGADTHGVVLWGNSSDAFDTGTEVCAARALTCVDVKTLAGVDSDCATDQGAATTHFYALCK